MSKRLRKILVVCSICTSISVTTTPLMAEETKQVVFEENNTASTAVNTTVKPDNWTEITTPYLTSAQDKTLDLTSLPTTANINISIPSSVTDITILGDSSKVYDGLTISLAARTTTLNLTIKNIKRSGSGSGIDVSNNTGVTNFKFIGHNELKSSDANGIAVYTGNTIEIDAPSTADTLTIEAGSSSAGIGGRAHYGAGSFKKGNGKIIINGGTLHVTGGSESAAIGGATGEETALEDISIRGGNITAIGGNQAAGIGAGHKQNKDAGTIMISGGTVVATGTNGAAGIGGGFEYNAGAVFNIAISGGTLKATGTGGGAGIGSGVGGNAKNIIITGGTIEAYGSDNGSSKGGAGIGGGSERGFNLIQIGATNAKSNNPYIKRVEGGPGAAAIGTGCQGTAIGNETILLYSGVIDEIITTGGAAGIGGGNQRGFKAIEVGYTRIGKVHSSGGGAAIGTGNLGSNGAGENKITILPGGVLYADAEAYDGTTSALGGGYQRDTEHSKVAILGETFLGVNKIGEYDEANSAADLKNYAFECYRVTGTTIDPVSMNRINTRSKMNAGDNFYIKKTTDPDLKLLPDTDGDGRIYAYLHDLGTNRLGNSGYYFQIDETGRTYIATEFERVVGDPTTLIKMEFVEVNFSNPIVSMQQADGSKIVPYSFSNIDFISDIAEDTSVAKYGTDTFNYVKAELQFSSDSSNVAPFDLTDINKIGFVVWKRDGFEAGGITPKYTYDNILSSDMKNNAIVTLDDVNKKITIEYPSSLKTYGEFKIRLLVPNNLVLPINTYRQDHVNNTTTPSLCKTNVAANLSYNIETHILVDGRSITQPRINNRNATINVTYCDLIKVN